MKIRMIPILVSLAVLVACAVAWPPRMSPVNRVPTFEDPLLPDVAELPQSPEIPDEITIFGRRRADSRSISVAREKRNGVTYRLCSFAGDDKLWVVGVQNSDGRYFTIRSGERIPGTTLEFRNMRFHTADSGLQTGDAVFFDNASSNYVDVMAYAYGNGSPNENTTAQ